jgi:hypothetical protein
MKNILIVNERTYIDILTVLSQSQWSRFYIHIICLQWYFLAKTLRAMFHVITITSRSAKRWMLNEGLNWFFLLNTPICIYFNNRFFLEVSDTGSLFLAETFNSWRASFKYDIFLLKAHNRHAGVALYLVNNELEMMPLMMRFKIFIYLIETKQFTKHPIIQLLLPNQTTYIS